MSRLRNGITVVIPSIPPRAELLQRAVASVTRQTMPAAAISVAIDYDRLGAAYTRQRALDAVTTRWTAFLDDDDEMLPHHLEALFSAAMDHDAEYVWSRFKIAIPRGALRGPFEDYAAEFVFREGPHPLGAGTFEQWNPEQPAQTTITTLVCTELARSVGGFLPTGEAEGTIDGQRAGEDWDFTLRCVAAAGPEKFRHVPKVTWLWHHHARNTSGLPDRW